MVYCGRLSAACAPCRQNRRKCDFMRPSCTQCIRSGDPCNGYRNPASVRFRNETANVKTKVDKKRRVVDRVNAVAEDSAVVAGSVEGTKPSSQPPQRALAGDRIPDSNLMIRAGEISLVYFMNRIAPLTSLRYLGRFWLSIGADKSPGLGVTLAMQACSLSVLAQDLSQPRMLTMACSRYINALAQVNKMIDDPRTRLLDTTLVSVLLLAAFENILSDGHGVSGPWTSHVQASARLVQMRGAAQFQTVLGQHLFRHVGENVRASCIQRGIPVPLGFSSEGSGREDSDLSRRLGVILDKFIHLKPRLKRSSSLETLQSCLQINEEIWSFQELLMLIAPFRTIKSPAALIVEERAACCGIKHMYFTPLDARRWNKARMISLFVDELILSTTAQLEVQGRLPVNSTDLQDPGMDLEVIRESTALRAENTVWEILAAVWFSAEHDSGMISIRPLVWPLFAAGASRSAPESARLAAIRTLEILGSDYHQAKATEAAELLKANVGLDDWARGPVDCACFVSFDMT